LPVLVILIAMLGGQVTELFDRWDNTLQTGRDIDYSIVIVAACAGAVFAVAKVLVSLFQPSPKKEEDSRFNSRSPSCRQSFRKDPQPAPLLHLC
jgi:hypothetical protein